VAYEDGGNLSGSMVAFINDHLAVLSNEVLHFRFSVQALNDGHIHTPRPVRFPTADMPEGLGRQVQEHSETL
jgi:hypothetical protein